MPYSGLATGSEPTLPDDSEEIVINTSSVNGPVGYEIGDVVGKVYYDDAWHNLALYASEHDYMVIVLESEIEIESYQDASLYIYGWHEQGADVTLYNSEERNISAINIYAGSVE